MISCGTKQETITQLIEVNSTKVPLGLLGCEFITVPKIRGEKELSTFLVDLHSAYVDCYTRLQLIKEFEYGQSYDANTSIHMDISK